MPRVGIRRSTTPPPPVVPRGYNVTGPTSGEVRNVPLGLEGNALATEYTVTLIPPYTEIVVTPQSADSDTTFSVPSLTLDAATPSGVISVSPGSAGVHDIVFSNNYGLANVTKQLTVTPQVGKGIQMVAADTRHPECRKNPDLGGYLLFGEYDPAKPMTYWNKQITDDPVDPNSAAIMSVFNPITPPNGGVHLSFGVGYIAGPGASYLTYGEVYNIIRGNQQPLAEFVCEQYCENSDVGPIRIDPLASAGGYYGVPVTTHPWPGDQYMPPAPYGYDQHAMHFDVDNHKLIETYSSYTPDGGGTWHGFLSVWDEAAGQLRPDGWTSATGGGTSKLQMTLRYDECRRGPIRHALRYTTKQMCGTGKAQWPARHAGGWINPLPALPWGSRIRLKQEYYDQIMSHPAFVGDDLYKIMARRIVQCMRDYGLVLDDYNGAFEITATMDERWIPNTFYAFGAVNGGVDIIPQWFDVLLIEPGYTLEGPTTGTVGVPTTYTVARRPITDLNFSGSLFLMVDGALTTPQVSTILNDLQPTGQLSWTFTQPGTYTISCHPLGAAAYWIPPPSITLVVT